MRFWLAIPFLLGSAAAEEFRDGDTVLKRASSVLGNPCDSSTNCAINWTINNDNPMLVTLGAGGCITGPFKLFASGRTIFEVPAGADYPTGCRTPK